MYVYYAQRVAIKHYTLCGYKKTASNYFQKKLPKVTYRQLHRNCLNSSHAGIGVYIDESISVNIKLVHMVDMLVNQYNENPTITETETM